MDGPKGLTGRGITGGSVPVQPQGVDREPSGAKGEAFALSHDPASGLEPIQGLAKVRVADSQTCSESATSHGGCLARQAVQNAVVEASVRRRLGRRADNLEVRVVATDETELNRVRCRGGAVFEGQRQTVPAPAEVEVGVTKRVKIAAAAKCLAGTEGRAVLAAVVDQHNGGADGSLKLAEVR